MLLGFSSIAPVWLDIDVERPIRSVLTGVGTDGDADRPQDGLDRLAGVTDDLAHDARQIDDGRSGDIGGDRASRKGDGKGRRDQAHTGEPWIELVGCRQFH